MARYHEELLAAAKLLIERKAGQRGRLAEARVRRSISTTYYALFHFLLEDFSIRIIGTENPLTGRRRIFVRQFTHTGLLTALSKLSRPNLVEDKTVDFLIAGNSTRPCPTPIFARTMSTAFEDAQAKRHDADYNLARKFIAAEALLLIDRVEAAIVEWAQNNQPADRDFKHALGLFCLLGGKLRSTN